MVFQSLKADLEKLLPRAKDLPRSKLSFTYSYEGSDEQYSEGFEPHSFVDNLRSLNRTAAVLAFIKKAYSEVFCPCYATPASDEYKL